jgi:hypothetical protein
VESADRGEGESGKELSQSRGSSGVWKREVVDVSGLVDEWSDGLEEGEIDEREGSESGSVGVGEDVEEELGGRSKEFKREGDVILELYRNGRGNGQGWRSWVPRWTSRRREDQGRSSAGNSMVMRSRKVFRVNARHS